MANCQPKYGYEKTLKFNTGRTPMRKEGGGFGKMKATPSPLQGVPYPRVVQGHQSSHIFKSGYGRPRPRLVSKWSRDLSQEKIKRT